MVTVGEEQERRIRLSTPIDELLPHRGAALLLDRALAWSPTFAEAEAVVRPTTAYWDVSRPVLSTENGEDPAVIDTALALEYLAQTIGVWSGYRSIVERRPPSAGLLAGTRRLRCHVPFLKVGERLRIEARLTFETADRLGMFDCRLFVASDAGSDTLAVDGVVLVAEQRNPPLETAELASAG